MLADPEAQENEKFIESVMKIDDERDITLYLPIK